VPSRRGRQRYAAKALEAIAIGEERLVAHGKERPVQGGEDRELVVRPLHRGERGAQGQDLLAIVEGPPADEKVRDPSGVQGLRVGAGRVLAEAHELAEEEADVARPHRDSLLGAVALGDGPAALGEEPGDEGPDRVGEGAADRLLGDLPPAVGAGHGERHDGRFFRVLAPGRERDVARLEGGAIVHEVPCERGVDNTGEARRQSLSAGSSAARRSSTSA
jgi:hypothetical protein